MFPFHFILMRKTSFFTLGLAGLLVLAACDANKASTISEESDSSSSLEDVGMDHDASASVDEAISGDDASSEATDTGAATDARVITMTAADWEFSPNAITAKMGENIVIRVTGVEGAHSFAVPSMGINQKINPGEVKDIVIPTDKAGTYDFRCMVPCGPGHKEMTGKIVIE